MQILPSQQLPTLRGSIYDRNGKVLASDKPAFYLHVSYELTKVLDKKYVQGKILLEMKKKENAELTAEQVETNVRQKLEDDYNKLAKVIAAGARLNNGSRKEIERRIRELNNDIWQMRRFIAWLKHDPPSPLLLSYKGKGHTVPFRDAMEDFANIEPNRRERTRQIMKIDDLKVMKETQPLIELNDKEKFAFTDIPDVEVLPETKRVYGYGHSACQIIGWVGLAQPADGGLFSDDIYSSYLSGEVAGKRGVEARCEPVLRGQRGEVTYNRDGLRIDSSDAEFGRDVSLTIDIELQRKLESYLTDPNSNTNYAVAMGAVIIDVESSDILAIVSTPTYDLNTVRRKYTEIRNAANKPFENKAMYKTYPPGSSIKPVMLAIGIDEKVITADEVISCPAQKPPKHWPRCWIERQNNSAHDWQWEHEGGNSSRNAIRGSCNIYFSHVADRVDPRILQGWLYRFGYGQKILAVPDFDYKLKGLDREAMTIKALQESAGQISSRRPSGRIQSLDDITQLNKSERRMFGIGQGGLRATVLQVANAMASIARGGVFKNPKLFTTESNDNFERGETVGVRPETVFLIREGMHAVVYEQGGTAQSAFRDRDMQQRDITVYGKTGSTQTPATAWFAGFAEDSSERCVAIAIVVEGGTSGAKDAAPLGKTMIEMCNELGYVGKNVAGEYAKPASQ